jgi:hypothetical protein
LEYIKEITINEAIVHILDNNGDEALLNEYTLELNEEVHGFLRKHIERCLKDEELKYAVFNEERNIVKEISQEYFNGANNVIDVSKELARQMFILMKGDGNIPSCDLVIVSISTEYGPLLGILKMDYIKNYTHSVDFIDNKVGINIIPELTGLPVSAQKIQKCAFIKPIRDDQEFSLMVIDKQSKSKDKEGYGSNYFISKYLGCSIIDNERDMTKNFLKAAEEWTRVNLQENADTAEIVRSTIKKKLKEEELIDVHDLSKDMFGEKEDVKESFKEYISAQGLSSNINIDKEWVEKKLKRIRLKIDKDIDLYINEEAYHDNSRFEIQRVGDGSINIIIKHVVNYIEK